MGFFGRSENPFPSILSFFSAALDEDVSIASGRERTQKETLIPSKTREGMVHSEYWRTQTGLLESLM